ncbi:hypothetical protein C4D60_Mb08t09690 [Musa balbisiana]|uniref:Uncharacterized protein n=1 Tax=Musa balbisiana TaxID=52838 RepID=A0A4V4H8U1_MUSBA|nr:hypothetical protein C4D60_Mb08t09690 [Musa balbisiana]
MKEFGSFLSSGKNSFVNAFLSYGGFTPSRMEVEEGDGGGGGKEENATRLRVRVGCGGDGARKRIELGGEGGMEAEGGHGRGWREDINGETPSNEGKGRKSFLWRTRVESDVEGGVEAKAVEGGRTVATTTVRGLLLYYN